MLNFGITVNALIHYLLLYFVYKTNNESIIHSKSVCGGTDSCMNEINYCIVNYYEDNLERFEYCFTETVFAVYGKIIDFPNKMDYYEKMYKTDTNVEEMKKVYFEFMLNSLKKCANNEKLYNDLFDYIKMSVYFDQNSTASISSENVDILTDGEAKNIADRLFYINKLSDGNYLINILMPKQKINILTFWKKNFIMKRNLTILHFMKSLTKNILIINYKTRILKNY